MLRGVLIFFVDTGNDIVNFLLYSDLSSICKYLFFLFEFLGVYVLC